jgi:hypothetical protein
MIINYGLHILEQLDNHYYIYIWKLECIVEPCPCMQMQIHVILSNDVLLEALILHIDTWFHITLYFVYWAISTSTELKKNLTLHGSKKSWSHNWESIRIMVKLQCFVVEISWETRNQTSVHFCNWGESTGLQIRMRTLRGTKLWIFWTTWFLNAKVIIITVVIIIWCNRLTNIKCALTLILL